MNELDSVGWVSTAIKKSVHAATILYPHPAFSSLIYLSCILGSWLDEKWKRCISRSQSPQFHLTMCRWWWWWWRWWSWWWPTRTPSIHVRITHLAAQSVYALLYLLYLIQICIYELSVCLWRPKQLIISWIISYIAIASHNSKPSREGVVYTNSRWRYVWWTFIELSIQTSEVLLTLSTKLPKFF